MTKQEQINNWLTIAFTSGQTNMSEFFYYDRRDDQFFSILLMDYFIFDKNLEVAEDTEVNYSDDVLKVLADRMKRIDSSDAEILSVPLAEANIPIQEQIDQFLNLNTINTDTVTIWEAEDPSITIKLN